MIEVWKDIPGYEGKYQVSNYGRVKSLNYGRTGKEKILKQNITTIMLKNKKRIVHRIPLWRNNKGKNYFVHRLVWTSFNGNIPDDMQIDHIDNNPENNYLDNLQLLTKSENTKKRFLDNPDLSISWSKKIKCLNTGIIYESQKEAARKLNLHQGDLSKVLNGKRKSIGGFHFEYV